MSSFVGRYTGKTINAINLGSYNYLGFAEKTGPCATDAIHAVKTFGVGICNTRTELGTCLADGARADGVRVSSFILFFA